MLYSSVYLTDLTAFMQIRIVVDTHQDEKSKKKKKKHRGYAFVVYEREKDMRGNSTTNPPKPVVLPEPNIAFFFFPLKVMALKLPTSFLYTLNHPA
jgi:hypothetical protein